MLPGHTSACRALRVHRLYNNCQAVPMKLATRPSSCDKGLQRRAHAPVRAPSIRSRRLQPVTCFIKDNGDKDGPMAQAQVHVKKLLQEADVAVDQLVQLVTPRQAYDGMDWILMLLSTAVFVWMAAGMYCVYAHIYYSMGIPTLAEMMSP